MVVVTTRGDGLFFRTGGNCHGNPSDCMNTAVAEMIVLIAVAVVLVLMVIGMHKPVYFMTVVRVISRYCAGSIRRSFESGEYHSDNN